MKVIKISIITVIILLSLSCVTTSNKLPSWVEIKPENSKNDIFFSFGPASSRELAKKGLYKEISEYFGVNVSSVDKFVKSVEYNNGESSVNQTKESSVEVTSREKGLDSIQIREIWSDSRGNNWCILASIDINSVKEIENQISIDIEKDRVLGILSLSEGYTKQSKDILNTIDSRFTEIKGLSLELIKGYKRVQELISSSDIIQMSKASLELCNKIYSLDSELSNLFNQIDILNKKNSLLRTQVDINDITSTELGFYIDENQKSLELSQNVLKRVRDIVTTTRDITQELNTLLLNSELDTQRDLELLMSQINSDYSKINSLRDESEFLLSNNENNLRKLKQILNSTTIDSDNKSKQTKEIIKNMEDNYNRAEDIVGDSFILKNSIESNYQTISKLNSVSGDKFNNLTELYNNISDPISWIEIYKNKSFVLYNNGKKLTE